MTIGLLAELSTDSCNSFTWFLCSLTCLHAQYNSSFGSRSLPSAMLPSSPLPAPALVYTRRRWLRSDLRFPTASSTCSNTFDLFSYSLRNQQVRLLLR